MPNRRRLLGSGLRRLGVTVKRTPLAPGVYVSFANNTPTVCCGLRPVAVAVAETVTIVVLHFPGQGRAFLAWRHADSRRKQSGNVTEAGR
jgi:hypothetical protein